MPNETAKIQIDHDPYSTTDHNYDRPSGWTASHWNETSGPRPEAEARNRTPNAGQWRETGGFVNSFRAKGVRLDVRSEGQERGCMRSNPTEQVGRSMAPGSLFRV